MTQCPVGPPCWMVTKLASGLTYPAWCDPGLGGSGPQNPYVHTAALFTCWGLTDLAEVHAKRTTWPWAREGDRYGLCLPTVRVGFYLKSQFTVPGQESSGGASDSLGSACPPTRVTPQPCTFLWHSEKGHSSSGNPPRRTPDSPTTSYPEALMCPSDN